MHSPGFDVPALVAVQLHWDAEVAEEVGHQSVCHCPCLLIGDGVNIWSLREFVHGDQEIPVSPVTFWESSSDVNSNPLNGFSNVLVHQAMTAGSGTSAGGTGVTLLTPRSRPLNAANDTVAGACRWPC